MYLNNCKDGMHGPLEVFSRGALISFAQAAETCGQKFDGGEQCTKAFHLCEINRGEHNMK